MVTVPSSIRDKYSITDADTAVVLDLFDEPIGSVIEVGCHDEPVASILSDMGFAVTGVDLRESNHEKRNFTYYRHDFCNLPDAVFKAWFGQFDVAIAISAIEHFGCGTYKEGEAACYYDVIAMRTIWQLLREGGVCYLTIPFGKSHLDIYPHLRVYSEFTLRYRLIQDFQIEKLIPFIADECVIEGKKVTLGDPLTMEQAKNFIGLPPHVTMFCKLRKVKVNRLAPDGR